MTLVFRTTAGSLIETQVGVKDVFGALSAAYSAYGWLGGLQITRSFLSNGDSGPRKRLLNICPRLKLTPVATKVLTSAGLQPLSIPNVSEAFGGDAATQVIGLTICAIAYECDSHNAAQLFMSCVAPQLFWQENLLLDSLAEELLDESALQRILNEGASRGLEDDFEKARAALNTPVGDRQWLRHHLTVSNMKLKSRACLSELHMVGGLLKWVLSDISTVYCTRSAMTARVALCLRSIGYPIGEVTTWDGIGELPESLGQKQVILVLGGTSETDRLTLEREEINPVGRLHRYRYCTTGALLVNSFSNLSDELPETIQTDFEKIYGFIEKYIKVQYICPTGSQRRGIHAVFYCHQPPDSKPFERRIAALYFPLSADLLAPCYRALASKETLSSLQENKAAIGDVDDVPEKVLRFRAVTAAIIISLASRMAPKDFKKIRHLTDLDLTHENWLSAACDVLDKGISNGLEIRDVVGLLAAVHAGRNPGDLGRCDTGTIGWRRGSYSVIPSLLVEMNVSEDAVGFTCLDEFLANIRTRKDGSIQAAASELLYSDGEAIPSELTVNSSSVITQLRTSWMGAPPVREPPDERLYLHVERPLHCSSDGICLAGRIDGERVGSADILKVLELLIKSFEAAKAHCEGHETHAIALNVKASVWARKPKLKPVSRSCYTFIPAYMDHAWALFLAGQTADLRGLIVFDCVECVSEPHGCGVLVGFGERP